MTLTKATSILRKLAPFTSDAAGDLLDRDGRVIAELGERLSHEQDQAVVTALNAAAKPASVAKAEAELLKAAKDYGTNGMLLTQYGARLHCAAEKYSDAVRDARRKK